MIAGTGGLVKCRMRFRDRRLAVGVDGVSVGRLSPATWYANSRAAGPNGGRPQKYNTLGRGLATNVTLIRSGYNCGEQKNARLGMRKKVTLTVRCDRRRTSGAANWRCIIRNVNQSLHSALLYVAFVIRTECVLRAIVFRRKSRAAENVTSLGMRE